jgi:hypothetical protein
MQLAHRAALNGVQLDSVDNRVLIQTVEPQAGKMAGQDRSCTGNRKRAVAIAVRSGKKVG